jgi:hypothetical protein
MAKTHPHTEQPTAAQLAALVADRPEAIRDAYLAVHRVVLQAAPDDLRFAVDEVDCSIGYAARQYGYDGWGMAALTPYGKWVALTFLAGKLLPDPAGLLQGAAQMRHVRVGTAAEVLDRSAAISELVRAAAALHQP